MEEIILFKEGIIGYKANLEQLHQQRSNINHTIQNLNNYHILRQEIRLAYRKVQARLFSIIIHFELNYFELIQSEIILLKKLEKKSL